MNERRSAAALFRAVGLLPDGPVLWGHPLPGVDAGVVVLELPEPHESAPLDPARLGKWIERVPTLRLDGEPPTTRRLAARLAAYWIRGERIVFVGFAANALGRRVAALARTQIGIRPPLAGAHWLLALRRPETLRVWWAATDAPEEYADALLDAFAEGIEPALAATLPEPDLVLPWATLARPTGERRQHGLTHDLVEAPADDGPSTARPASAAGAGAGRGLSSLERHRARPTSPAASRSTASASRSTASSSTRRRSPSVGAGGPASAGASGPPAPEPVHLSTDGLARLEAELEHLRRVERPAVIARVRAARELGDLRENAEYQAAREEQAFLEGRIRALEDRLRRAVVVDRVAGPRAVGLGSVVLVEIDGRRERFEIVGPAEADPGAGRLSVRSPVGAALLGGAPGDERTIVTPSGQRRLRILAVE